MTGGLARRFPVWLLILAGVIVAASSTWAYRTLAPLDREFFRPSRLAARGLVAYLAGDYARAGRLYRASFKHRMMSNYLDDPSGLDAVVAGDIDTAGRRARLTLLLVPGAIEPRITLGEIAIERRRFGEALTLLEEALSRRPDDPDALYLSVIALVRGGRHGEAIERLNRALLREAVGTRPLVLWRVMELAGDLAERSTEKRPLCLLALLHRYLRIFDPRQAIRVLAYAGAAIDAGDRPAEAWVSVAIVRRKLGDSSGGADAMQRAFALDPRQSDVAGWLAGDAQLRRDLLAEYRMTRAAFENRPTDPYFLRFVDDLIGQRLGDPRTVVELMERAIAVDPSYIPAHVRLARAAERLGDTKRAAAERALVAALEAARRASENDD
jgi:tetratricopeptide (TPR) repeat protein